MGLHLCAMLHRGLVAAGRQPEVIAVSRFETLRSREDFSNFGITTLACDLERSDEVARLPDAGTVFFLAGVKFGTASAPDLLHRLNVRMPRLIAERFPSARIVAFSSGCVYPYVEPATRGSTEECSPAPVGDYAMSCMEREAVFADCSRRHGTQVAIVRLNYSIELRYGVVLDVAGKVWRGEPIDLSTGYFNAIWQGDAVAIAIQSATLVQTPPAVLNVAGPEIIAVRQLAARFGGLFGRQPLFSGTEAPTAWLSDASRSRRLFGPPSVSLGQVIDWTAAWIRDGGATWGKPTGYERRDGRF